MKLALLGPIAWRTPPRHYGPWELVTGLLADGLARAASTSRCSPRSTRSRSRGSTASARGPYEEDADARRAHLGGAARRALPRALGASSTSIHNHLDWLPLAFSGLARAPLVTTIHGFSSPRILPAYQRSGSAFVSISDADRVARARLRRRRSTTASTSRRCRSRRRSRRRARVLRPHPPRQGHRTRRSRSPARAERPLVLCGTVQDERYFAEQVEPHVDGDRVRYLGSVGPAERADVLGAARLPAAPDRVRRAVRALGRRVDGVRHAGRRLRRAGRCRRSSRRASPACWSTASARRSRASSAPRGSTAPRAGSGRRAPLLGRPHGRRLPRRLREASSMTDSATLFTRHPGNPLLVARALAVLGQRGDERRRDARRRRDGAALPRRGPPRLLAPDVRALARRRVQLGRRRAPRAGLRRHAPRGGVGPRGPARDLRRGARLLGRRLHGVRPRRPGRLARADRATSGRSSAWAW